MLAGGTGLRPGSTGGQNLTGFHEVGKVVEVVTGQWLREGAHAGNPTDLITKHRVGFPWYVTLQPWRLHRSYSPQTVEPWQDQPHNGFRVYSQPLSAGGTVSQLETGEGTGCHARQGGCAPSASARAVGVEREAPLVPQQRTHSLVASSIRSRVHVTIGR